MSSSSTQISRKTKTSTRTSAKNFSVVTLNQDRAVDQDQVQIHPAIPATMTLKTKRKPWKSLTTPKQT
jgi:hypothetical protein